MQNAHAKRIRWELMKERLCVDSPSVDLKGVPEQYLIPPQYIHRQPGRIREMCQWTMIMKLGSLFQIPSTKPVWNAP